MKNTPRLLSLAAFSLILILALSLPALAAEPRFRWKASTLAPRGVGWAIQVENLVFPALDRYTDGNLEVKVYWGGILGDDEDILQKMREDVLQVAGFTAQGSVMACKEFAVLELPFLFRSFEEVDHVRDRMYDRFAKLMEDSGFYLTMWIDQDFDQLYSTRFPLTTLADFSRATFLSWAGPLEAQMLKSLGAKVVTGDIPDISRIIKGGEADSLLAPSIWIVGTQMHSVTRFVNPLKLRYSPAAIVFTQSAWKRLPPDYQKTILKGREEITEPFVTATRKDGENFMKAMTEYGVKLVSPNEETRRALEARTAPLADAMTGILYPAELLQAVRDELAAFRSAR
ncbi:MAG: TRAP transporter substrate-binding protein DctP [Pseudomonadota bacterium]